MDYIIVTNTLKRPLQLVARSINSSLNQKIKPIKIIKKVERLPETSDQRSEP